MTINQLIKSRVRRVAVAVTLIYIVAITLFSLVKLSLDLNEDDLFPHFDKVIHFCLYFGLNLLLLTTMRLFRKHRTPLSVRTILTTTLFAILYSLVIEYLQPYFGREMEMLDGVANISGAITGAVLFLLFRQKS